MPDGGIKKHGVVVVCDCLFYGLIDGATHSRIVLTIRELSYDQTAQMRQHAAPFEIANHAVNVLMTLADIFDKKDRKLLAEEFVHKPVTGTL